MNSIIYTIFYTLLLFIPCIAEEEYHDRASHAHLEPSALLYGVAKNSYEKVPDILFEMKPTTVFVYIAGCNDLLSFIERNLMQLMQVGTNPLLNIVVCLNTIQQGRRKITQRLIIYKNKIVQVGDCPAMDSGDPETLIQECTWAFTHCPSKIRIVILWNHGTGGIEPNYRRAINPSELYLFNPNTNMIELNRSIGFLEYLQSSSAACRGICFDDITKHYLTNRQVGQALRTISERCLNNEPIDIVCCDACLMAGIEVAYSLKPYRTNPVARYLVASQEIVLATGYPYTRLFAQTAQTPLSAPVLARHIVDSFAQAYHHITQDYTHSAIDLSHMDRLYESINSIALLLIEGMKQEINNSAHLFIKKCSSKELCTYFEEPTYKDIHHLFTLMKEHVNMVHFAHKATTDQWKALMTTALTAACDSIKEIVIANKAGNNLAKASGLSIYLPSENIHHSYAHTDFGSQTQWLAMLRTYIHGTHH